MSTSTVASRIEALRAHVPGLTLEEIDDLAGLGRGHASQIVRGRTSMPRPDTLAVIAGALGTTVPYLAYDVGRAPGQQAVRRAVAAARERLGADGRHAPKVDSRTGARKPARASSGARSASRA